jgi:hypothetical protein
MRTASQRAAHWPREKTRYLAHPSRVAGEKKSPAKTKHGLALFTLGIQIHRIAKLI